MSGFIRGALQWVVTGTSSTSHPACPDAGREVDPAEGFRVWSHLCLSMPVRWSDAASSNNGEALHFLNSRFCPWEHGNVNLLTCKGLSPHKPPPLMAPAVLKGKTKAPDLGSCVILLEWSSPQRRAAHTWLLGMQLQSVIEITLQLRSAPRLTPVTVQRTRYSNITKVTLSFMKLSLATLFTFLPNYLRFCYYCQVLRLFSFSKLLLSTSPET